MRKCSPTNKINGLCSKFLRNAGDLKKRSSPTNSQLFHKIQSSKIFFFCKFSGVFQDKTTLLMTLARFQHVIKQCCPQAEDRTFSRTCVQGEGLQIVSSRTSLRPRTPLLHNILHFFSMFRYYFCCCYTCEIYVLCVVFCFFSYVVFAGL